MFGTFAKVFLVFLLVSLPFVSSNDLFVHGHEVFSQVSHTFGSFGSLADVSSISSAQTFEVGSW